MKFHCDDHSLIPSTGTEGIVKKIRDTVGDRPVYLSIDVGPSDSSA